MDCSQQDKLEDFLKGIESDIRQTYDLINEYLPNNKTLKDTLKASIKEICEADLAHQHAKESLAKTKDHLLKNPEASDDCAEVYKQFLICKNEKRYEDHQLWKKFLGADDPVENNDASLICSGSVASRMDPITKAPIKNACRNITCNHIYDFDTITMYINSRKRKAQCPYVGCKNKQIALRSIVRDEELQAQIDSMPADCSGNASIINISL